MAISGGGVGAAAQLASPEVPGGLLRSGSIARAGGDWFERAVKVVIDDECCRRGPIMAKKKTGKSQRQRPAGPEMTVFVSWSKDSKPVAELFCGWLPKVIQQVKVWQSEHIESGAKWFLTLSERLSENDFGVLMVTKKNLKEPWLQFEAGALSKAVHSKVTPVLCNLSLRDLVNTPLQHLQGLKVDRGEFWKLISNVNGACAKPLNQSILKDSFETRWPEFEMAFKEIKFEGEAKGAAVLTVEERLEQIEDVLEAILISDNGTSKVLTRSAFPWFESYQAASASL
jgi:TIR domain